MKRCFHHAEAWCFPPLQLLSDQLSSERALSIMTRPLKQRKLDCGTRERVQRWWAQPFAAGRILLPRWMNSTCGAVKALGENQSPPRKRGLATLKNTEVKDSMWFPPFFPPTSGEEDEHPHCWLSNRKAYPRSCAAADDLVMTSWWNSGVRRDSNNDWRF